VALCATVVVKTGACIYEKRGEGEKVWSVRGGATGGRSRGAGGESGEESAWRGSDWRTVERNRSVVRIRHRLSTV